MGVLEPWNIRCCLKYPKGENQDSEMLIFWPDFPGDTKYYPLNGPHLKKGRKRKDKVLCTSHNLITSSHQCILMHYYNNFLFKRKRVLRDWIPVLQASRLYGRFGSE